MGRLPRVTDFFNGSETAKLARQRFWQEKDLHRLKKLTLAALRAELSSRKPPHEVEAGVTLHPKYYSILARGTKFVPVPKTGSEASLLQSFNKSIRQLHVKNFFAGYDQDLLDNDEHNLKPQPPTWANIPRRPGWDPRRDRKVAPDYCASDSYETLKSFELHAKQHYNQQLTRAKDLLAHHRPRNVPPGFFKRAKELKRHPTLIVRPADKNLGLCISSRSFYRRHVLQHLHDELTYSQDPRSPAEYHKFVLDRYSQFLHRFRKRQPWYGLFEDSTLRFLSAAPARRMKTHVPYFYILWKIHKPSLATRPLAAAYSWVTTNLSRLVGWYLLQVQQEIPEILSDSRTLVKQWDGKVIHHNLTFITLDVKALYPNIPHELGLQAARDLMLSYTRWPSQLQDFILRSLEFILRHSAVQYENVVYRQTKGTAMGTNMAVSYANLFLAWLWRHTWGHDIIETKWSKESTIISEGLPVYYRTRFVDDIFLIATKGFGQFIAADLNRVCPSISVTYTEGDKIAFLDLCIFKHNNTVMFSPYTKPFNKHLYLPYHSYHRRSQLQAWLKAELLRLLTNSSTKHIFYSHVLKFFDNCRARGYPNRVLHTALTGITYSIRQSVLHKVKPTPPSIIATKITFEPRGALTSPSLAFRLFKHKLPSHLQNTRFVDAFVPGPRLHSHIMSFKE